MESYQYTGSAEGRCRCTAPEHRALCLKGRVREGGPYTQFASEFCGPCEVSDSCYAWRTRTSREAHRA